MTKYKLASRVANHIVDSTALLAVSHPVYGAFETFVAGMNNTTSLNARLFASALTYGGMGYAWNAGRNISRKISKVSQESKEWIQTIHDGTYSCAFNLVACPLIYFASGARDVKEIAIGTASAMAFNIPLGPILGYTVDAGRDLVGLGECNRPSYPLVVKNQRPSIKKTLAGLVVATSISTMAGIYTLHNDKLEQKVVNVVRK